MPFYYLRDVEALLGALVAEVARVTRERRVTARAEKLHERRDAGASIGLQFRYRLVAIMGVLHPIKQLDPRSNYLLAVAFEEVSKLR